MNNKPTGLPIYIIGIILIAAAGFTGYQIHNAPASLKGAIISDTRSITASSTLTSAKQEYDGTSESKPLLLGTSTTWRMEDPISETWNISEDFSQFCMNIAWTPSTTDAVLNWKFYASQDGDNWYAVDYKNIPFGTTTNDMLLTVASSTEGFPALGAGSMKMRHYCPPVLSNLNAKWLKVEFSRTANLSGGKLFAEGWFK